jgi:hypothetical protein
MEMIDAPLKGNATAIKTLDTIEESIERSSRRPCGGRSASDGQSAALCFAAGCERFAQPSCCAKTLFEAKDVLGRTVSDTLTSWPPIQATTRGAEPLTLLCQQWPLQNNQTSLTAEDSPALMKGS